MPPAPRCKSVCITDTASNIARWLHLDHQLGRELPNNTHLTDYSLIPPIKPGDAWAGHYIGAYVVHHRHQSARRILGRGQHPSFRRRTADLDVRAGRFRLNLLARPLAISISENIRGPVSWSDYESPLSGTGSELTKLSRRPVVPRFSLASSPRRHHRERCIALRVSGSAGK